MKTTYWLNSSDTGPDSCAPRSAAWRVIPLLALLACGAASTGCVPIPYRPEAHVTHAPVTDSTASSITVSTPTKRGMTEPLGDSIKKNEPRIEVMTSGAELLETAAASSLSGMMSATGEAPAADYVLTIGPPVYRKLHDTGAAAPFVYFPVVWVGYEKVQSVETMCASLVDMHAPGTADGILVTTAYTETIAALVYGVSTVAMPETSIRNALAADVAQRLAAAQPSGRIRLMILAQDGGDEAGAHVCAPEPPEPTVTRHYAAPKAH